MPETYENWLSLVNSYVYYAHQTHEIYQVHVLPYSVDYKAPRELWNPLSKTVQLSTVITRSNLSRYYIGRFSSQQQNITCLLIFSLIFDTAM